MMFTACPPLVMKPCTREPSRKCTRWLSTRLNVWITAESAEWPSHGDAAACDGRPVNENVSHSLASA